MSNKSTATVGVVVPNWNGADDLRACLDSLQAQTYKAHIIVVDNGSIDDSVSIIEKHYPDIELIRHDTNKGYTGGVNPGFRRAQEMKLDYVAPFNNDAIADKDWLRLLVQCLDQNPKIGIATCKILSADGKRLDSTGDLYTSWGLPYPRGRGEEDAGIYDNSTEIFGASGGASLYRVSMLNRIDLFDEDFFAYYEDVDLSFRAQLAGWRVRFVPASRVYHQIGMTSGRIKDFTTYQTLKNLPWVFWKNVPTALLFRVAPRFLVVYTAFWLSALRRGQVGAVLRGCAYSLFFLPKKLVERFHIQRHRVMTTGYIWSIITQDLPPNAFKLRRLRARWWRLVGRPE